MLGLVLQEMVHDPRRRHVVPLTLAGTMEVA